MTFIARFLVLGLCVVGCGGVGPGSHDGSEPDATGVSSPDAVASDARSDATPLAVDAGGDRVVADAPVDQPDVPGADRVVADGPAADGRDAIAAISLGWAEVWLASMPAAPCFRCEVIQIEGTVTQSKDLHTRSPEGAWYAGEEVSRALVIRTDAGVDWTLGFRILPDGVKEDITPTFPSLVGKRVKLVFRAVRSFGSAPAFVLTDATGLVFAVNMAIFGDAFKPDDLPSLMVRTGRDLGVIPQARYCYDARHFALVFTADSSVELDPGHQGEITIEGARYTAVSLLNLKADGQIRCTDTPDRVSGWAVWRRN